MTRPILFALGGLVVFIVTYIISGRVGLGSQEVNLIRLAVGGIVIVVITLAFLGML